MESKNISLRKSTFADCALFSEWEKQEYITEYLAINKGHCYENIVKEFVIRETDDSKQQLTIVAKTVNKAIGRIYISKIDNVNNSLDISRIYIGEKEYVGKGYGKETMFLLLAYCFELIKRERVTLDYFTGNVRAANLYSKVGFTLEGVLRNAIKKDDKYYDLLLMSILKSEYFSTSHSILCPS